MKRTLDWKPRFDERSKKFPIRGMLRKAPKRVNTLWLTGPILDQGQEGACVGFGWTAKALADPFSVDLSKLSTRFKVPRTPVPFARKLYGQAKLVDEYPGEDYEGTSVLAGAKVLQSYGVVKAYSWAFSVDEVIDGILSTGPVVLGVNWYDGMYEAPNGVLTVSGELVGGHCLIAVGYNIASKKADGEATVIVQNSWGRDWGTDGLAEIRVSELARLLKEDGEACLPLQGAYQKKNSLASALAALRKKFFGI